MYRRSLSVLFYIDLHAIWFIIYFVSFIVYIKMWNCRRLKSRCCHFMCVVSLDKALYVFLSSSTLIELDTGSDWKLISDGLVSHPEGVYDFYPIIPRKPGILKLLLLVGEFKKLQIRPKRLLSSLQNIKCYVKT